VFQKTIYLAEKGKKKSIVFCFLKTPSLLNNI